MILLKGKKTDAPIPNSNLCPKLRRKHLFTFDLLRSFISQFPGTLHPAYRYLNGTNLLTVI